MSDYKGKQYKTIMPFFYTKTLNGNMTCFINEAILEQLKQLKIDDCLLFRKIDHNKTKTKVDAYIELMPPRESKEKDGDY